MEYSDLTIKCNDGDISTCKFICAHNPVLKMMISRCAKNTIISFYSKAQMTALLMFTDFTRHFGAENTQMMILDPQIVYNFLEIADFYGVEVEESFVVGFMKKIFVDKNYKLSEPEMKNLIGLISPKKTTEIYELAIKNSAPYEFMWSEGWPQDGYNNSVKYLTKYIKIFGCEPPDHMMVKPIFLIEQLVRKCHKHEMSHMAKVIFLKWCNGEMVKYHTKVFYELYTGKQWRDCNNKRKWMEKLEKIRGYYFCPMIFVN